MKLLLVEGNLDYILTCSNSWFSFSKFKDESRLNFSISCVSSISSPVNLLSKSCLLLLVFSTNNVLEYFTIFSPSNIFSGSRIFFEPMKKMDVICKMVPKSSCSKPGWTWTKVDGLCNRLILPKYSICHQLI